MSAHPSFFKHAYDRRPPWDIGRPQREIVRLEAEGLVRGDVLDVGCGTGDNALYLAEHGHRVVGVDLAETAIAEARRKARERGLAQPVPAPAGGDPAASAGAPSFTTVTDCGFFHALDDAERVRFADVLATLLEPGGLYLMLCFSDRVPGSFGPRRVSQAEIRATFARAPWSVREIRAARLESSVKLVPWVPAWLSIVERLPDRSA
jgi:cyclopropane fatty-acyl-phospholipid synthase-like methyltransferase